MTRLLDISERLEVDDMIIDTQRFLDKHSVHVQTTKFVSGKGRYRDYEVDIDLSHCGERTKKIATAVLRRGINIRADIRRGQNHLSEVKPKHLYAVQEQLARHGEITHEELKQLVRQHSPTSKDLSVSNSASWTAKALIAIGVVEKYGDHYVLID